MENIELKKLSNPLEADDIDFKPKGCNKYGDNVYCTILAYKDARVDMYILDDVCGPESWQNEYRRDSQGILQCGIGIKCVDEWVWKWSNGVPSEFEAAKGEYSDAFKRAGFMWGIGRSLYDFPSIRVILNEEEIIQKDNGFKPSGFFKPNDWAWTLDWGSETGGFKLTAVQTVKSTGKRVTRFDSNPYDSKNQRK